MTSKNYDLKNNIAEGVSIRDDFSYVNVKWAEIGAIGDGKANDTPAIQKALDLAEAFGGVELFIPAGVYRIKSYLIVHANTKIRMSRNTVLLRSHPGGIFKNGYKGDMYTDYNGNGNIHIEGGTLDGNVLEFNQGFNLTGWARGTNLTFRDITFKDVITNHCMDINACKDVLIENCRFLGYKDGTVDQSRNYPEAIQISNHTQAGYSDFGIWDGTSCQNIIVRGCYFGNSGTAGMSAYATGIGNHGAVHDLYNQNIKITDCTFEGMTYAGIRPFKFKDLIVRGNLFLNCQRGIVCSNPNGEGESSKDGKGNQTNLPQSGTNYIFTDNIFRGTKEEHLYIVGWEKDGVVAKVDTITVSNNQFESQSNAAIVNSKSSVYLSFVKNLKIDNNDFKKTYRAIYAAYVSDFSFTNNKVEDTTVEALFVNEPDDRYKNKGFTAKLRVSNNTIKRCGRTAIMMQYTDVFNIDYNLIEHACLEADNVRSAIVAGSGSKNGTIRGNKIVKATNDNQNKHGIEVTPTCQNIQVFDNNAEGKTARLVVSPIGGFSGFYGYDTKGGMRRVTIDVNGNLVISDVL
ncbi:hypothetical protein COK10_10820 [Bacillus anthracis]|nr:hypothetical protein COK10_10820 [Bacillus anthracis]